MKKIKYFEEYSKFHPMAHEMGEEEFSEIDAVESIEDKPKLGLAQFKELMKDALNANGMTMKSKKLIKLKITYPYIREEQPYKAMWWETVKKWHLLLKDASEEERIQIEEYTQKHKSK